ncbi:MAG: pyridoxamine 5'-phosphate oxidase family protein [Sandaracinaceae bacterium]
MSDDTKEFESLLGSFDTAMLVTHGDDDVPRARPMHISKREGVADLYFATRSPSPKIQELIHDSKVAVTMQDKSRYLSISGRASVVTDRKKIEAAWSAPMKAWFPDGPSDPDLVLVHVEPERGEYWDMSGMKKAQYLFEAAKAVLRGETIEPMEDQHGEVRL